MRTRFETPGSVVTTSRRAVVTRFAIDLRALAAFRIALGALLLADLARRAADLTAFYTDAGVVPRSVVGTLRPGFQQFSLHAVSGAAWAQWVLFIAAGAAAVALLVGYRTRVATAASLALLVSLHLRNPLLLNSGDVLLRRLLFWGLFLPLGEQWAVDAAAGDEVEDPRRSVVGPATAGLLLQVVAVYATNAVVKFRGDAWVRGDAVHHVFQLEQFTVLLGDALATHSTLLTLVNWSWLGLLVCSPLLVVLSPGRRTPLIVAFATAHVGMALTMQLGLFPLVSVAALLPFLPGRVWNRVSPLAGEGRERDGRSPASGISSVGPSEETPQLRTLLRTFVAVCVIVLVTANAVAVGVIDAPPGAPDAIDDQSWDMFAPSPPGATIWLTAPGTLESGERVDALHRRSVDGNLSSEAALPYPNERWRKLLSQVRREPALQGSLARFLCWRWNRNHDDGMVHLRLVAQFRQPQAGGTEPVQRRTLKRYRCG